MLASRSVSGSRSSERPSATFSSPIAAAVWFALVTRLVRSARRSARSVTTFAVSETNFSNTTLSRTSSRRSVEDVESAGLKYLAVSFALPDLPRYWAADPCTMSCRPLRVGSSKVLKSWSRSTGAVVLSARISPPLLILGPEFGPSVSDT